MSLLGDFNRRTSDDDDFILVHVYERREGDDTGEYLENEIYTLDQLNIPCKRSNRDKVKNGYGEKMLDCCKGNNFFILHGRLGDDKGEGRVTCKGVGTVDYCICTSSLLEYCTNFSSDFRSFGYFLGHHKT